MDHIDEVLKIALAAAGRAAGAGTAGEAAGRSLGTVPDGMTH